ncbi:putative nuclease HARBI1 [Wyeomyia smithii]|uniref:putative nuclease HARBI1 n=1 Tax=Wyeomyia smithii TaxID=174621 RepID=UPI002467CFB8|nr:putative nuclease HARBI1 [Wyeomyia smithii]
MASFPSVIGIIDRSLIPIDAPITNEEAFVDRKGLHSINCMFVCGSNLDFFYVSAKWPGSVHDARVLRRSTLFQRMEEGNIFPNGVILEDSAYPLKTWLMKPLNSDPTSEGERRYNNRLKSTRQTIERALGVLKEKFLCLNHLRVNPHFAGQIVKCCATLCNISRENDEDDPQFENQPFQEVDENNDFNDDTTEADARRRQMQIIHSMY